MYLAGRDYSVEPHQAAIPTYKWTLNTYHADLHVAQGHYVQLGLKGAIQQQNAAAVICAVALLKTVLPVPEAGLQQALSTTQVIGRFQTWQQSPTVIADVGHNAEAIEQVLLTWQHEFARARIQHLVLGVLADKNVEAILALLAPHVDHWHLAAPDSERALPVLELQAQLQTQLQKVLPKTTTSSVAHYATVTEAVSTARQQLLPTDRLLIVGSFVTLGEAMQLFADDCDT